MVKDPGPAQRPPRGESRTRRHLGRALTVTLIAGLSACAGAADPRSADRTVTVWRHSGTEAENEVVAAQVSDFNAANEDVQVEVRSISEGDYHDQLQAAAAARALPDLFEIDGPLIATYAYQDVLAPLTGLLTDAVLDAQLPSLQAQGTIDGEHVAVGVFDSGLGLYADRRQLRAAGISTWPTSFDEAWTGAQFSRVLSRLAERDSDGAVLDVKRNYGVGEWLTYGFSPLVASSGGELIDPATLEPKGHLDGAPAQRALAWLARWSRFVDPNIKDAAFTSREVALSWVGHWVYRDYAEALGDDLLVLPLPDLGNGSKTGQGSWAWAVNRTAQEPDGAARFLEYLLQDDQILRLTEANGAVPGSQEALAASELYGADGPLRLFAEQLLASCGSSVPTPECAAVPRPTTPGYPALSAAFAAAADASLAGGDPAAALREGADDASDDLAANGGYQE